MTVLDCGLNPGPPALEASTIPLGYRGASTIPLGYRGGGTIVEKYLERKSHDNRLMFFESNNSNVHRSFHNWSFYICASWCSSMCGMCGEALIHVHWIPIL